MQDRHHPKFANLAFQGEPKVSAFAAKGDTFDSKLAAENGAAVNGSVKSHHASRSVSPPRMKKKDESHIHQITEWVARHQIGLSVNLLALLALTHLCFPRARRHTRKFTQLSYFNPETNEYTIGWDDACFVFHWIVLFSGLRAAAIDYILVPFAQWGGIEKKKDLTRFAEQAWLLIYYIFFIPIGVWVMYNSDYWLSFRAMWRNWPNREINGPLKWYYLVQFGFWLQQIVVVHIEERRRDYAQMFTHHIITCLLMFCSYGYHQTAVGNVILVLMDVVDLFLPLAKCLKYLKFGSICDIIFGIFMVTWVIARHILYLLVCWSIWSDIPREIQYGCYTGRKASLSGPTPFYHKGMDRARVMIEPFRNPGGKICFDETVVYGFLAALLFLQALTLMWFWMICKVAVKVLKGGKADDVRSDDEEEVEDVEVDIRNVEDAHGAHPPTPAQTPGIEIGDPMLATATGMKGRTGSKRRSGKKSVSSSASGVDRKELLGRIGCDKGL